MLLTTGLVLMMNATSVFSMKEGTAKAFYNGKCIFSTTARHNNKLFKLVELIAYAAEAMGCLNPEDPNTLPKFALKHSIIYNGKQLKEIPLDAEVNEFKPNVLVVVDENQLLGFNVPVIIGDSESEASTFFIVRRAATFEEFYATAEAAAIQQFGGTGISMVSGNHEIKSMSDIGINRKGQLMGTCVVINSSAAIGGEEVKIVIKK